MKTKKMMSFALALIMALSLAVPAFASGSAIAAIANTDLSDMGKIDTAVTTINAGYQAPVLALTVPKTISAMLNPYAIELTLNKDTAIEDTVTDQIASPYNMIISRSSVPLTIHAKATGTIAGPEGKLMTLAKASTIPAAGTTPSVKKEAYVWMQFGKVDTTAVNDNDKVTAFMQNTPSSTAASQPFAGITASDITWATAPGTYADANTPVEGIIIAAGEGKEHYIDDSANKYKLDQVTFDPADATKATSVSAVAFRLNGDMVANPKDASWGKEDKLTVSVAWKFVPGSQVAAGGNGITATYDASNPAAITFTTTAPTDADQTTPVYTVTSVAGLTGITAANCTWNGTTVTIPTSELNSATELDTDGDISLTVGVSYSDGSTTKTDSFRVTLTVSGN